MSGGREKYDPPVTPLARPNPSEFGYRQKSSRSLFSTRRESRPFLLNPSALRPAAGPTPDQLRRDSVPRARVLEPVTRPAAPSPDRGGAPGISAPALGRSLPTTEADPAGAHSRQDRAEHPGPIAGTAEAASDMEDLGECSFGRLPFRRGSSNLGGSRGRFLRRSTHLDFA
jgi:hypothetical protein